MNGKMESFLEEYRSFKQHASEQGISKEMAETLQLFAIYRKDERSNEINGNSKSPATEKQKSYIRSIYAQNGAKFDEKEMEKLTKKQASEIIDSFKGGG